jgi:hypothetical protein
MFHELRQKPEAKLQAANTAISAVIFYVAT